jgi:hypothetical protein
MDVDSTHKEAWFHMAEDAHVRIHKAPTDSIEDLTLHVQSAYTTAPALFSIRQMTSKL